MASTVITCKPLVLILWGYFRCASDSSLYSFVFCGLFYFIFSLMHSLLVKSFLSIYYLISFSFMLVFTFFIFLSEQYVISSFKKAFFVLIPFFFVFFLFFFSALFSFSFPDSSLFTASLTSYPNYSYTYPLKQVISRVVKCCLLILSFLPFLLPFLYLFLALSISPFHIFL